MSLKVNDILIESTRFSDNTTQVWKLPETVFKDKTALVTWDFSTEGEFMELAQLKMLLDRKEIPTSLFMPYLPYARQDKGVSNVTTFALRSFAELLNSLNFKEIVCYDPHSVVAQLLIRNFKPVYPIEQVLNAAESTNTDLFCYPDEGALKKYADLYNKDFIYGEKERNQLTGQIINYKLCGDPTNKNILIVDDLCDGGNTFILLTAELLKAGAKQVNLFVSHGLFSRGVKTLKDKGITHIYTKNGLVGENSNGIFYSDFKECKFKKGS